MNMTTAVSILDRVRSSDAADPIPTAAEIRAWVAMSRHALADNRFMDLAAAQLRAAEIWGAESTSHFGMILREARVKPKAVPADGWRRAEQSAMRLPEPWRKPFLARIALSRAAMEHERHLALSAAHLRAMSDAFGRWLHFNAELGQDPRPTAVGLETYADAIRFEQGRPVSQISCASYLERILGAYRLVVPTFVSDACTFVVVWHREGARRAEKSTKTGAQLIGASAVYAHGFALMKRARNSHLRGTHAARDFRNGILLAMGIALPQRARALSRLVFDETLFLPEPGVVRIHLPGDALKLKEIDKPFAQFERTFRNPGLYSALTEYRDIFRPILDPGLWLFPSLLDRMHPISERSIGRLTGDLLERQFGVRIPVHRLRDNVATEASEELEAGARAIGPMLGHSRATTGQRHYDHSEGVKAAREYAAFLDRKRSASTVLKL